VALTILSAEQSSKPTPEIPDLYVLPHVLVYLQTVDHPGRKHLSIINKYFSHKGPNGSHLCLLISQFAGPSLFSGKKGGEASGECGGSLAFCTNCPWRFVPKNILALPSCFYSFVCAKLTSSNILFRIIHQWPDNDVYQNLGSPEMENIRAGGGHRAGPLQVVPPIDISLFSSPSLLQEDVLIDFGQSFLADSLPPNYEPATPLHYLSPEAFFDSKSAWLPTSGPWRA